MTIRIATIKDIEAITEIYNQAIAAGQKTGDTLSVTIEDRKKWFETHASDKYPILVMEVDDIVVGYLSISAYRPGRLALQHTAEISYFVHFKYHRKGIASNLLQHAIAMCPSLQIKNIFAIVIDTNQVSVRLLEKFGFEKWGHMPRIAEFDGIEIGHLYYGLRIQNR
jgi:phosphinothricin acetyltransferase